MTLTGERWKKVESPAPPDDEDERARLHVARARALVAEKRYAEAERLAASVVEVLEQGVGEAALLADALTTQGVARARRGDFEHSVEALRRAARVAEEAGALPHAALALVSLVEEHGATRRLPATEVYEAYLRADRLLRDSQPEAATLTRLRACARVVMRRMAGPRFGERDFTLHGAVKEFESGLIERALEKARGSITHAARLLGLTHQSLGAILSARHSPLAEKRTPVRKRLRSIIRNQENEDQS